MVGGDAVSVGGAKATVYPFALDGGAELKDDFGVALSGDGSRSVGAQGEKLLNVCQLLGGELRESLVARDEVVENCLLIGGSQSESIHAGGELHFERMSGSVEVGCGMGEGGDGAVEADGSIG